MNVIEEKVLKVLKSYKRILKSCIWKYIISYNFYLLSGSLEYS